MIIVCWSAKGGSGTTVVSAALALALGAADPAGCLAIDLAGDLAPAFGSPEPPGPGVFDWMTASPAPDRAALLALHHPVGGDVALLAPGPRRPVSDDGWERLADVVATTARPVVVDAGHHPPPPALAAVAHQRLLVTRSCYLGLRRAAPLVHLATGVVVIEEPGRAINRRDVAATLRLPLVAVVPLDPAVARAVDAGLLAARLPASLFGALRGAL